MNQIEQENARRGTNRERALALLEERGARGATNEELMRVAGYRFGARLWEARQDGVAWLRQHERGGLWRYWLADHAPEELREPAGRSAA